MDNVDKSLSKIHRCSYKIYDYAMKKYSGKEITKKEKGEIQYYVIQMKSLLPSVDTKYQMAARKLVSEGILDANYVIRNARMTSFRMGHVMSSFHDKEQ